jgi:hypothetical protein
MAGSFENCNKPLGSIEGEKILDQLRDYQLLNMNSITLS